MTNSHPKPPSGEVTFLFTDIVGSTEMWETLGDAFLPVLQAHNAVLTDAMKRYNGYLIKTEGDAYKIAFSNPADAIQCAILAQAALQRYPWPPDVGQLTVRMAAHTGKPFFQAGDYFGPPLNRTARILSTAHGGQIIISGDTAYDAAKQMAGKSEFTDLGAHQLRDLDEPVRLFQVSHPSLSQQQFPPPNSLNRHAHNLPRQRTSFIGREAEIEKIAALLGQADTPVLTLTGPPGAGKTRLTLQAAAEQIEGFPDGVWFIQMTDTTSVEDAARQAANQLKLDPPPIGVDWLHHVRAWLAKRKCLIIVDDCGSSTFAATLIRELISEAPSLRCLATSRDSLHLEEGAEMELGGLMLPTADAFAEQLLTSEGGRLFAERVAEIRPDIEITDRRAKPISRLLASLGGLPGQIERAANEMKQQQGGFAAFLEQAGRVVVETAREAGMAAKDVSRDLLDQIRESHSLDDLVDAIRTGRTSRLDLDQAENRCREALATCELNGDREGMAKELWHLGKLAFMREDHSRAITHLDAALDMMPQERGHERLRIRADIDRVRRDRQIFGMSRRMHEQLSES